MIIEKNTYFKNFYNLCIKQGWLLCIFMLVVLLQAQTNVLGFEDKDKDEDKDKIEVEIESICTNLFTSKFNYEDVEKTVSASLVGIDYSREDLEKNYLISESDFLTLSQIPNPYLRYQRYADIKGRFVHEFNIKTFASSFIDSKDGGLSADSNQRMIEFLYPQSEAVVNFHMISGGEPLDPKFLMDKIYQIEYGNGVDGFWIHTPIYDYLNFLKELKKPKNKKYKKVMDILSWIIFTDPLNIQEQFSSEIMWKIWTQNENALLEIRKELKSIKKLLGLDKKLEKLLEKTIKWLFYSYYRGFLFNSCTGVIVSHNTLITAGHCIVGKNYISFHRGNKHIKTLAQYLSETVDLGVLRFPDGTFSGMRVAKFPDGGSLGSWGYSSQLTREDKLIVVSSKDESEHKRIGFINIKDISKGIIQSKNTHGYFAMKNGDSGSPLFNDKEELIGISVGTKVSKVTSGDKYLGVKSTKYELTDCFIDLSYYRDFFLDIIKKDPKVKIAGINLLLDK